MKVKLNIRTHREAVGDVYDWAEVEVGQELRERVFRFWQALSTLDADYVIAFDYSPEWHFKDTEAQVDCVTLVVGRNGDCWWEGHYENDATHWETGAIPFDLLAAPLSDEVHDLRPYKDDEEVDEEGGHG